MLKTIKGKVIAGTVSLTLLAGAGAAFANLDAGTKLENWYKGEFNKASGEVGTQTAKYSGSLITSYYNNEYKPLKTDATTKINDTKILSTSNSSKAIKDAKDIHVQAVNTKSAELLAGIEAQFNGISTAAKTAIDSTGAQGLRMATTDLTTHTGKQGKDALASVKTDLEKASSDAKDELTAAIDKAKLDLGTKLATEKGLTITEIKDMMDKKLTEISGLITLKQQELVAAQQKIISDKAAELEKAAIADLQSIVDGI